MEEYTNELEFRDIASTPDDIAWLLDMIGGGTIGIVQLSTPELSNYRLIDEADANKKLQEMASSGHSIAQLVYSRKAVSPTKLGPRTLTLFLKKDCDGLQIDDQVAAIISKSIERRFT